MQDFGYEYLLTVALERICGCDCETAGLAARQALEEHQTDQVNYDSAEQVVDRAIEIASVA